MVEYEEMPGRQIMKLKSFYKKGAIEVACDEAGRGCLAGPVFAAAVILKTGKTHPQLNDSKKLSAKNRDQLRKWIEEHAQDWAVASVSNEEIDEINILNASFLAMHRAVDQIKSKFEHLLIDGNRFRPYANKPHHCIVKGDAKYKSIAAASILAKTHRDEFMEKLAKQHPQYGWSTNFGYPTSGHRAALKAHGKTKYHRNSFQLFPTQMELKL